MKKNRLNKLLIALIGLGLVIVAILLFVQTKGTTTELKSFTVENSKFVVRGENIGRIEVWGIPTGTNVPESDYYYLTNMLRTSQDEGEQEWVAAIPVQSYLLSDLFVRAYDENGVVFGTMSLPYKGATEIYNAVWPFGNGTSTTATQ